MKFCISKILSHVKLDISAYPTASRASDREPIPRRRLSLLEEEKKDSLNRFPKSLLDWLWRNQRFGARDRVNGKGVLFKAKARRP
jgi:hypothetical protein